MSAKPYSITDLLRVMTRLRDPEQGCPWDLKQDFKSIISSTLEECYELAQAIENEDYDHVAEELGDVLFQVVFYAQLGDERKLFDFDEVVSTLVEKLVRRHPHVFYKGEIEGVVPKGAAQFESSIERVKESWEQIKQREREAKSLTGILDDVPSALPALPRAQKIQKRAASVNFDWPDHTGALLKLKEEIAELEQAIALRLPQDIEEELGDMLFSCVNVSRHLGLDAETSLRRATSKFERRFKKMTAVAKQQGRSLDKLTDLELDALWLQAKNDCDSV